MVASGIIDRPVEGRHPSIQNRHWLDGCYDSAVIKVKFAGVGIGVLRSGPEGSLSAFTLTDGG